ncbi:MAG: polysaccharide deacetylase family protein [Bacteroidota bacterium]
MMNRRTFLTHSALVTAGISLGQWPKETSHVLSLSFDDGFRKSFYQIADIHERYGLSACLNVIATGHFADFDTEPEWIPREILGNFEDWNALKARGHEIMPHTWRHRNLPQIPLAEAKANIDKCLDYFEANLQGYRPDEAVYNFAYNASTPELEAHALQRVKAVRTGGWLVLKDQKLNGIPPKHSPSLGCWGHGPEFCDEYVAQEVQEFLASEGGWLILNLHGLDDEGWGPIRAQTLDDMLKRWTQLDKLEILPTGAVLNRFP